MANPIKYIEIDGKKYAVLGGTGENSHAEGLNTSATNVASHAEGGSTEASGQYSHAEGYCAKANGNTSHAEGKDTDASGDISHAEGNNTIASGHASHAEGAYTRAIGLHSHAQGYQTTAYGGESTAMGYSHNQISQDILDSSQVDEDGNFIMETIELARWKANRYETPEDNNGDGFSSLYGLAGGGFSTSEGLDTLALGRSSHSEGNYTIATGMAAHAEGSKTEANAFTAHAEGEWTVANGLASHAEGLGTIANAPGQHAQGMYNISMNSNYLHIVGNGAGEDNRSNAHTIDWKGNGWFAGDVTVGPDKKRVLTKDDIKDGLIVDVTLPDNVEASGFYEEAVSHSSMDIANTMINGQAVYVCFTNYTIVDGSVEIFPGAIYAPSRWEEDIVYVPISDTYSVSLGYSRWATIKYTPRVGKTLYAHGEIFNDYVENTAGFYSHAEGQSTTASGSGAHTEGRFTMAYGDGSHAEGDTIKRNSVGGSRLAPQALGRASHAEGTGTIAGVSGDANICASHAEGVGSQALETAAHAEGFDTKASGKGSHAQGYRTIAQGGYSHSEGLGTIAAGLAQHVEGAYNEEDTINSSTKKGTYIHIVGNGSASKPSNAYTLDWNGNGWFAGDVTVGSNKEKLATESLVQQKIEEAQLSGEAQASSLIVTIIDDIASHTSAQIYDHIQNGGVAYLFYEDWYYPLIATLNDAWVTFIGDDYLGFVISINEDRSVYYQDLTFLRNNDDIDMNGCDINNVQNITIHNQLLCQSEQEDVTNSVTIAPDNITISSDNSTYVSLWSTTNIVDDEDAPIAGVAEFYGIDDTPVVLRRIADGIEEYDAINKKQLGDAMSLLQIRFDNTNILDPWQLSKTFDELKGMIEQQKRRECMINVHFVPYEGVDIIQGATMTYTHDDSNPSSIEILLHGWGKFLYGQDNSVTFESESPPIVINPGNYQNQTIYGGLGLQNGTLTLTDKGFLMPEKIEFSRDLYQDSSENLFAVLKVTDTKRYQSVLLHGIADGIRPEDAVNKRQLDAALGNIELALDSILTIQNNLIGGDQT